MENNQKIAVEKFDFWCEVERRRNVFYYVWAGWLIAGFPLTWLYELIIGSDDPMVAMSAALYTWFAIWMWTLFRLTRIRCIRCDKTAISHPFFFMKRAKCKSCGFAKSTG